MLVIFVYSTPIFVASSNHGNSLLMQKEEKKCDQEDVELIL